MPPPGLSVLPAALPKQTSGLLPDPENPQSQTSRTRGRDCGRPGAWGSLWASTLHRSFARSWHHENQGRAHVIWLSALPS